MLNSCYFTHKINVVASHRSGEAEGEVRGTGQIRTLKKSGKSRPEELLFGDTKIYIDSIS